MKLKSFILATTLGLTGAAYASQAATVPATQQPKTAQQHQRASSPEPKEKKKASSLTQAGRFALGAGFIALSIFTGLKAKEEYQNGQSLATKAKKLTKGAKEATSDLPDKTDKALGDLGASAGSTVNGAKQPQTYWQRFETMGGEGKMMLKKFGKSCINDPSPIQTAGWATTSVCSLVLGMRLILQAVGFVK